MTFCQKCIIGGEKVAAVHQVGITECGEINLPINNVAKLVKLTKNRLSSSLQPAHAENQWYESSYGDKDGQHGCRIVIFVRITSLGAAGVARLMLATTTLPTRRPIAVHTVQIFILKSVILLFRIRQSRQLRPVYTQKKNCLNKSSLAAFPDLAIRKTVFCKVTKSRIQ